MNWRVLNVVNRPNVKQFVETNTCRQGSQNKSMFLAHSGRILVLWQ